MDAVTKGSIAQNISTVSSYLRIKQANPKFRLYLNGNNLSTAEKIHPIARAIILIIKFILKPLNINMRGPVYTKESKDPTKILNYLCNLMASEIKQNPTSETKILDCLKALSQQETSPEIYTKFSALLKDLNITGETFLNIFTPLITPVIDKMEKEAISIEVPLNLSDRTLKETKDELDATQYSTGGGHMLACNISTLKELILAQQGLATMRRTAVDKLKADFNSLRQNLRNETAN